MKCPFCSTLDNKVVDSRLSKDGHIIRRRRECDACARRFTTYERVDELLPLVIKRDGRREAFERAKLIAGIARACEKRPIGIEQIEGIVDRLELTLQERAEREVSSSQIGAEVMRALHDLDEVAYVRFASVYQQFNDINQFMDALTGLMAERGGVAGSDGSKSPTGAASSPEPLPHPTPELTKG